LRFLTTIDRDAQKGENHYMNRKVFVASVIVVVLLLLGGFLYVRGTPYYSIYQFAGAVNNRDPETALTYIDVDSIVESLVKGISSGSGNLREGTRKAVVSGITMNMESVKDGVRQYIIASIRSGEASGETRKESGGIGIGSLNLHQIKKNFIWDLEVKTEGTTAFVRLKQKPGQTAKMIKTEEGYWKFTEILFGNQGKD
jgi:hypothetical protein